MSSRTRATKVAAPVAAQPVAAKKAAAAAKPRATKKAAAAVDSSSGDDSDDDDDVEMEEEKHESKRRSDSSSSESSASSASDSDEEEAFVPAAKKKKVARAATATAAAAAAPAAAAKKTRVSKKASAVAPAPLHPMGPGVAALSPAAQLHAQLGSILSQAQSDFSTHAPLAAQAMTLLAKDPASFQSSFLAHASFVCASTGRKMAAVQRLLQWMGALVAAAFSSPRPESQPFAEEVLQQLLLWSTAKDKSVRARSCALFGEVIVRLHEEAEVPDFLFDRATEALLERCRDKYEAVRVAAAAAMHRLQVDTHDDRVLLEYVRLMRYDTCKEVRRIALQFVAAHCSPDAIAAILARTQDVEPVVRAAAFKCVQNRVHMKQLRIEERARLIRTGFHDRVPEVSRAARALAESWLKARDDDVVRLLRSLAVEEFTEECSALLTHCFKNLGSHKSVRTSQPPYASDELTPERALYWRVLAETLKAECAAGVAKGCPNVDAEASLEAALPDTVELVALLAAHKDDPFISSQLASLCLHGVDLADEAGRRELGALVEGMLRDINTAQANVPGLMKVFRLVHEGHSQAGNGGGGGGASGGAASGQYSLEAENSFIRVVLELLADIRDPLEVSADDAAAPHGAADAAAAREQLEARYAQLQTDIEKLQVQKQACINTENYAGAEAIKTQLSALLSAHDSVEHELNSVGFQDDATWGRLLTLVNDLLEQTRRTAVSGHAGLQGLFESIIWPGFRHDNRQVSTLGLKAMSLYALLDRDTAGRMMPILLLAATDETATLVEQSIAMRAITDLLMMFEDLIDDTTTKQANNSGSSNKRKSVALPHTVAEGDELAGENKEDGGVAATPVAPAVDGEGEGEEEEDQPSLSLQVQSLFVRHLMVAHSIPTETGPIEVCVMALECLAKLFLYDRIPGVSSTLISAVLAIFFHPQTDTRIVQMLAVFFPAFLLVSPRAHASLYFNAILPTLRLLHDASSEHSNALVPEEENVWKGFSLPAAMKAMLSFLAHAPSSVRMDRYPLQQALAIEIAHHLLAFPASATALQLVQAMACLTLTAPAQPAAAKGKDAAAAAAAAAAEDVPAAPFLPALQHLLARVQETLRDKVALKELTKFVDKNLAKLVAADPDADAADELTEEQIDAVEVAAAQRVGELQEAAEAEAAELGAAAGGASDADQHAPGKKAAAAAGGAKKKAPATRGKRALRPKTPAKGRKGAQSDSDSDSASGSGGESSSDNDDEEEDGFRIVKSATASAAAAASKSKSAKTAPKAKAPAAAAVAAKKPAPSRAAPAPAAMGRPVRASKAQAQAKMEKAHASQADVDKILDAESQSEDSDDGDKDDDEEEDSEEDSE